MDGPANYKRFWMTLRQLGHRALERVPTGLKGVVDTNAENTDDFWSAALVDTVHFEWKQAKKPEDAVYPILLRYAENVRNALSDYADDYKVERIDASTKAKVDKVLGAALAMPLATTRASGPPPAPPTAD